MELSVNDSVKVSGQILTKDNEVVNLEEEPGVIKKLDGEFVYVSTQHGTHYLLISQIIKEWLWRALI